MKGLAMLVVLGEYPNFTLLTQADVEKERGLELLREFAKWKFRDCHIFQEDQLFSIGENGLIKAVVGVKLYGWLKGKRFYIGQVIEKEYSGL
jgi:hypothetical protein